MRALKYCLLAVVAAGAFLGGYSAGYRHGVDDTLPPPRFEAPPEEAGRNVDWTRFARRAYRAWRSCRPVGEQEALDAAQSGVAAVIATLSR